MDHKDMITLETASLDDCSVLAEMNKHLIDDEGDDNPMTVPELEKRMRDWLQGGVYTGYLFKLDGRIIGYALVDISDVWMRHFFICREYRRRGHGRAAVCLLLEELGVEKIGLSCLTNNATGQAFWRSFDHEVYSVKFNIHKPVSGRETKNLRN
jgi:predicted acetyltransferase